MTAIHCNHFSTIEDEGFKLLFSGIGMSVGWGPGPIATDIFLIFYKGIVMSLWSDHIVQMKFHCIRVIMRFVVQSTISMHSILMLRETRCSEIESEGILESIYLAI